MTMFSRREISRLSILDTRRRYRQALQALVFTDSSSSNGGGPAALRVHFLWKHVAILLGAYGWFPLSLPLFNYSFADSLSSSNFSLPFSLFSS